ncbi:hypothetical protein D3C71_1632210 [compost metagenome]
MRSEHTGAAVVGIRGGAVLSRFQRRRQNADGVCGVAGAAVLSQPSGAGVCARAAATAVAGATAGDAVAVVRLWPGAAGAENLRHQCTE